MYSQWGVGSVCREAGDLVTNILNNLEHSITREMLFEGILRKDDITRFMHHLDQGMETWR